MKWLGDRWRTVSDALGPFWVKFIIILSSVAATALGFARDWLDQHNYTLGLPPTWVIIWVVGSLLVVWWLLDYATKLRESSVAIKFDAAAGGLQPVTLQDSSSAVYIRPTIVATSAMSAKRCRAYLKHIEVQTPDGPPQSVWCDGVPIRWAHSGQEEIEIPFGIGQHLDLLVSLQSSNELLLCGYTPNHLIKFFTPPAKYILEFAVVADGVTILGKLTVIWNGQWNQVKAEPT
jgi:hypothetical protein